MQEERSDLAKQKARSIASPSLKLAESRPILTLGLLSVLGVPVIFAVFLMSGVFVFVGAIIWLLTLISAIVAIVVGYRELNRMKKGITDSSQRKRIAAGMWLGGLGSILLVVAPLVLLSLFSEAEVSSFYRDPLIYDLNKLAADAYKYRVRPIAKSGGEGSYYGYAIPEKFSKNDNGSYTALILHPDTIQFRARSIFDSTLVMIVKIGPDGQLIQNSWIYLGFREKNL